MREREEGEQQDPQGAIKLEFRGHSLHHHPTFPQMNEIAPGKLV